MIKVLLVDDDVEMLQGLANIICWEDYGFTISGRAANGLEALNKISVLLPDVVVTDITMPGMDGLELIREAKKFRPGLKSVIISCHEDFRYAREAIRLEADEYILKHTLTGDELVGVMDKIKAKLESEQLQRESIYKTNRELKMNKDVILEKFYSDIMENNAVTREEIYARAALSGIAMPGRSFRLISSFADDMDDVLRQSPIREYGLLRASVLNIIEDISKGIENINVFPYQRHAFGLMYWDNTAEVPVKQKIISMIREIQQSIQSVLCFKMSFCISSVYGDIMELKKAAAEVEALRDAYFFKGPGEIVAAKADFRSRDPKELYREFGPEIKSLLSMRKRKELSACLDAMFKRASTGEYAPNSVRVLLRHLMADLESALGRYEVNMENFEIKSDTFAMCRKTFEDTLSYVFDRLEEPLYNTSRQEIRKVIEYIDTHISEEISCDNMANYVNMNSSYFSRLFKSEVGSSFSDYLVNKRMEMATELLGNTDFSIERIAKTVGIESLSYFYRVYKKITGNTPGDIRNKSGI